MNMASLVNSFRWIGVLCESVGEYGVAVRRSLITSQKLNQKIASTSLTCKR